MTSRCDDWRQWPAAAVQPLVALEVRTWFEELGWDVAEAWSVLEPARTCGRLPGFIARDARGRAIGWTCFVQHRGCLQVIALVAASTDGTCGLVDAILASPQARSAKRIIFFVRDAAPALVRTLAERGLQTTAYRYLSALSTPHAARGNTTAGGTSSTVRTAEPGACRSWTGGEAAATARLCERAYARSGEIRAFAPNGTPDEWREYVANLLTTPDCGRFLPVASFVIAGRHPGEIDGVVLTTSVGPGTAHIAQLAVDPAVRGRGFGRQLVRAALEAAESLDLLHTTLLVSAANERAVVIYTREGFNDRASFVVAESHEACVAQSGIGNFEFSLP